MHQSEALQHGGPSLYAHDISAVFITHFPFYGATLYTLTGALGILLGSVLNAYVLTFILGFGASYGGFWWLARQAGLGRLVAHVPGIVFVTSAYSIGDIYVRGAWPEHVAVSMIPLLVASGISVLRADRLRPGPALALLLSVIVFSGSHNLTLLCGTVLLVVLAVLLLAGVPQARNLITRRGLMRVAWLAVPALMVNAWFLVPDIVYRNHTRLSSEVLSSLFLALYRPYVNNNHLFTLGRGTVDPEIPHLSFALPVLAMAWVVISTAVSRPRLRDQWLRVLLILAAVTTLVILAMTHVSVLRGPFIFLQFSYRLESYINLTICGAVLATLVLLRDAPRTAALMARMALVPIVAVSIVLAVDQSVVHRDPATYVEWKELPGYFTRGGPPTVGGLSQAGAPLNVPANVGSVRFPAPKTRADRLSVQVKDPPGTYIATNITGVWALLDLRGASFYGTDGGGGAIVQLTGTDGTISVGAAHPPAVIIGRLISFLGLALIAANLVLFAAGTLRRRRRRGSDRQPAGAGADVLADVEITPQPAHAVRSTPPLP